MQTLNQCPTRGCAKIDTPDALSNILKHNVEPTGPLRALTFADFRSLQKQADSAYAMHYATLTTAKRARLRHMTILGKPIGEGHLVEIIGYIAELPDSSEPHANSSGESVNCRLKKAANNDFHISLTPKAKGSEYDGIVVEMIPQDRDADWTEARLKAVQHAHRQVRARGQLFFDNHHKVNDDASSPLGNQPKRMSLWEVHPVTEFHVCTNATCEAGGGGWVALDEWQ